MRFFEVTLGHADGRRREIVVPSKTKVQAQDAATEVMTPGESILDVVEIESAYQEADTMPPGTQTHPDKPV